MKCNLLIYLLLFTILSACAEKVRKQRKVNEWQYSAMLFNLEHLFSSAEHDVSFPVWFNDSVLREQKIKEILRKEFNGDTSDFTSLRSIKHYYFSELGELKKLETKEFYDGQEIMNVTFDYESASDEYGYAIVKYPTLKQRESTAPYKIHEKEEYTPSFLAYVEKESTGYRFYILHEKHWGVLSIDSMLDPSREDLIYLGTPGRPSKKYQVENRINEFNVRKWNYGKSGRKLRTIVDETGPFYYKRSLCISKKKCTGFIDSTFSLHQFLMERKTIFTFNESHLPKEVRHRVSTDSTVHQGRFELFEYRYYD